jgi:hypothetical protein
MKRINLFQLDHELDKILLDKENIPVLEHLIEKEGKFFSRLERLKQEGKLDFGREMVGPGICDELEEEAVVEVYNILKRIQPNVNSFLNTKDINFLNTGDLVFVDEETGSGYNPDGPTIIISMTNIVNLTAGLAHEYAHHVQYSVLPHFLKKDESRYQMFKEGHARGVERYISNLYGKREANKAFKYEISNRSLFELMSFYKWVCFALDVKPDEGILEYEKHLNHENQEYPLDPWAKGNALFYIQETFYGDKIYEKVLKENRKK